MEESDVMEDVSMNIEDTRGSGTSVNLIANVEPSVDELVECAPDDHNTTACSVTEDCCLIPERSPCDIADETGINTVTATSAAAGDVAGESLGDCEPEEMRTAEEKEEGKSSELPVEADAPEHSSMDAVDRHTELLSEQAFVDSVVEYHSEGSSSASESSVDTEESDQFGGYTVNHVSSDSDAAHETSAPAADTAATSSTADTGRNRSASGRVERARRKRLHSLLRQSSSSDNAAMSSDNTEVDSDVEAKTSRLDVGDAGSSELPADTWKPLVEVFRRQLGMKNQELSSRIFERRAGGSVSLANRMTLHSKHEVHDGCVNALHFNQSGSLIASGSDDLKVVVRDWVQSKTYISFDTGHRSNVFQAKFLPHTGDCHIVTCARDGQVRLAQLSTTGTCKSTKRLAAHKQAAHKLALLHDSPHVFYSCGEDAVVYQVDLRQEQPTKCYTTKENDRRIALYSIHANPSNSFEHCVGGRDQFIRIYDVRKISDTDDSSALVKKFCPHHLLNSDFKAHVTCAVYNYNGCELIGSYNDEDIYLFDNSHSDGAEHQHKYAGHRNNATVKGVNFYGPKSEFVVSGSDCGNVFVWHCATEKIVNFFHADDGGVVNVLEPHPHIPLLATSGLDNDIKLWMPTASESASWDTLHRVTRKNQKEREDERNEPDVIDSQMLWFLMHTLRRNAARRAASAEGSGMGSFFGLGDSDQSDDSPADDNDNAGNDDDDDDDGPHGGRSQCTIS